MLPRRLALLIVPVVAGALVATQPAAQASSSHRSAKSTIVPASITDQALTWKPCITRKHDPGRPRTYYRQQCTTMTVPEDWADPTGPTLTLKATRLPATQRPAKGALFTNPGGPGAEGADLPLVFGDAGRKALLRGQDIYGLDVRGSGESDNATCGNASTVSTDPRVRTDANLGLLMDSAAFFAEACTVAGGSLVAHIDTAETVRDFDLLRSLIKVDRVNWLGYSAGTWLSANYSAAFPEHTGRIVFDSTVDFTTTWQAAAELQPLGFQRRFTEDFLPWAAKYDRIFHLGTTPAAVNASYEKLRASIDPRHDPETAVDLDQVLSFTMYTSAYFPIAALILMDDDGPFGQASAAAFRELRETAPTSLNPLSEDAETAGFYAVTCNDTPWGRNRNDLVDTSGRLGAAFPLIGWSTIVEPCAFWDRQTRTLPLPTPTGAGVPPSLFVQSVHDPATPIEGARRAAAGFAGSHLLVVTQEGDHAIYAGGNACVDRAVESYLNAGTLPAADATCKGNPLPGPDDSAGALRTQSVPSAGKGVNPLVRLRRIEATTS